jgi:glycyl-tRNA synthetase beta chain
VKKGKKREKRQKQIKTAALNALLEIGCEEIPARFVPDMLADLKTKAEEELKKARLPFSKVLTLGTGRRLVLYIEGLPESQADLTEERKGPPKDKAFDQTGRPTQTAVGFAKSIGVDVKDLKFKAVGDKEYVFATSTIEGMETQRVLSDIFPKIITALYLPLAMKWGSEDFKFIRPIHWILAMLGKKSVKFNLAGINSSDSTRGHRYFSDNKALKVRNGADLNAFKSLLSRNKVIVDHDERAERIKAEISKASKNLTSKPLLDSELLKEVTFLVEFGTAVAGRFKPDFLELPKDVLITSMKKNQKYFSLLKASGELDNVFIAITDMPDDSLAKATAAGNEKVLTARLSDAKFFFDEDKKVPLSSYIPELKGVSFHEKLGSVHDKVKRIEDLSLFISKELKVADESRAKVKRIAELCKADLLTKMVFEFPDLQGIVGREYACLSNEDKAVADGIFEHYLPRFTGDILPKSIEGAVVSIADKLDSIVGCFSAGLIPTGSADPFGLRRQAHGIVEIIFNKKLTLSLELAVERSYKLYEPVFLEHLFKKGDTAYKDFTGIKRLVLEFLAQRLRNIMLSEGVRYDVADASLASFSDVLFAYQKCKAIMKLLGGDLLKGIVMTSDRVSRIAKIAKKEQVRESDFIEDEERALHETYLKVNWEVGTALDKGDMQKALEELSKMTVPVDTFFDKILVMHEDEKIKVNRLSLLKSIELMYLSVADFPKIVI